MIPLLGAHDFPYIFSDQAASLFSLPLTWTPQSHDALGVFNISTLWDWPYSILYGLAGKIGLNFTLSTLFFGVLPAFVIGWLTMGKLLKSYSLSSRSRFVGQLLFVANTYILMLIDGGQLSLAIAYSLLPAGVLYIYSRIKFILVVLVISFLDIRYLYLLFLLMVPHVIINLKQFKNYLITGLITGLVLVGAHSYWLVPSLFSRPPSLPTTYTRPSQINEFSFASLTHSFFLIQPHWPKNIFGQISLPSPYFFLLPILAFLPMVVVPRDRRVAFWIILALLSAFLVKGSQPPFTQIYPWLFSHFPGFFLFRDPTKFFPLLALSYSVLLGYSCQYLFRNFRWLTFLIIAYLIFLISPILIGQGTGLFSLPRNSNSYLQLARYLESDPNPGSIVWIPSKPPLGFSSPIHPSTDALTLLSRRPFAVGVVGNYELLNFLRDASASGQLLSVAGVRYLGISAPDPKRDSQKLEDLKYREIFTNQLSKLPWIKSRTDFGPVTLFEIQSIQPLISLRSQTKFIIGGDSIYKQEPDLSTTSLVFVESQPGLLNRIYEYPQASLLLDHKTLIDIAANLIPSESLYFPSHQLDFDPDISGWWKRESADLIAWRDFLHTKYNLDNQDFDYGQGLAISEGKNTLTIKVNSKCESSCILLARSMQSSRGGNISFIQSGKPISIISTMNINPEFSTLTIAGSKDIPVQTFTYDRADFYWKKVGIINTKENLSITTVGDINVINALAIVPSESWEEVQKKSEVLLSRTIVPKYPFVPPSLSFKKINPTRYVLNVTGVKEPISLVFSQNYDPLWNLSGQAPVPVYSFLNSYSIVSNGEYTFDFTPQKYVWMQWIWDKISETK